MRIANLGRSSLLFKVTGLGAVAVLSCSLVILGIIYWQGGSLKGQIAIETRNLVTEQLTKSVQLIYNMCQVQDAAVNRELECSIGLADAVVLSHGGISQSGQKTTWQAVNQFTKQTETVELPLLQTGETLLQKVEEVSKPVPLIDTISSLSKATCTLFQRMPDDGMLRVATSVVTKAGKRAVGTYIPAKHQGKPNQVVATLLSGQTFYGRAFVVDAWYLTVYQPLKDQKGSIIGALYVGIKQSEALAGLRQALMHTKIGETGYVWILGAKGDQRGQYILSKDGKSDGQEIWDALDAHGNKFVQTMIGEAVGDQPGKVHFLKYPWKNPGETEPRIKRSGFTYFPEWNWVIGLGAYDDEFRGAELKTARKLDDMLNKVLLAALIMILAASLLSLLMARRIANPIRALSLDLGDSAGEVSQASEQIATASQNLSEASNRQAAGLEETVSAVDELNGVSKQSAQSADQARNLMNETTTVLAQTGESLGVVNKSMEKINQTSEEMSKIIKTIDEIAFQTNLLALNAAVEAARAGEAGAGFTVVAEEVRQLARRAAEAAQSTQSLIQRNDNQVRESYQLMLDADQAFNRAKEETRQVVNLIAEIAEGSQQQAHGLEQISQSSAQIDRTIQQGQGEAEESAAAAQTLAQQAQALNDMVHRLMDIVQGEKG